MEALQSRRVPPALLSENRETPWAHRLTLLSMFIFVAKVANVVPHIGALSLGKVLIALSVAALAMEGGGWWEGALGNALSKSFLWLLAIATITTPLGIWHSNSVHYLLDYYKDAVLVFLIIATTRTPADLERVIWAFVVNTVILVAVLFQYGDTGVGAVKLGKNEIAMTAVMALGLAWPMETHGFRRLLKLAVMLFLVAGVLHSVSRGSYLGLGALGFVWLYQRFGHRVLPTALLGVVLALGTYAVLPPSAKATIGTIIHYRQDYNLTSSQGRIEIWKHALIVIRNHPLDGVGIGNFPMAEGQLHPDGGRWMDAHNAGLQIASELGVFGLLVFLWMLRRMVVTGLRVGREARGTLQQCGHAVFLATIAYLVTGFFLSQAFSVILYAVLAMAVVMDRLLPKAEEGARVVRS